MNSFDAIERALGPIPLAPVVGGKPLNGDGVIPVVDPATEEAITEIADGTVAEALAAVGTAHRAQDAWAKISPRSRSEILRSAFGQPHDRARRGPGTAHRSREREGPCRRPRRGWRTPPSSFAGTRREPSFWAA